MARLPRLTLAGFPHHIIQRGNNRQPTFTDARDFDRFLGLTHQGCRQFEIALHSYVLMSNHFHLLATPAAVTGLPQLMQFIGRSYVRYFNDRHGRTGTLWEGRYRSTLIQSEQYLLSCMAYIDLNPVRAGIVAEPALYAWSSYGHYAGLKTDPLVEPHPLYWELGNTPFSREIAYTELVAASNAAKGTDPMLTEATLKGWALGDQQFVSTIRSLTPRRPSPAASGRPKRN
jgi:putative transposase